MSQSEKPFTVSDRRHFTPDGRPREEAQPPAADEPAPPPPEASSKPRVPAQGASGPADLGQFLLSLATQAQLLLSGSAGPEGPSPQEALDGARSIISILEMLGEKTQGRRSAEEDAILERVLFELRMAYVEKARAGGS